jgi:hypothetical protein
MATHIQRAQPLGADDAAWLSPRSLARAAIRFRATREVAPHQSTPVGSDAFDIVDRR